MTGTRSRSKSLKKDDSEGATTPPKKRQTTVKKNTMTKYIKINPEKNQIKEEPPEETEDPEELIEDDEDPDDPSEDPVDMEVNKLRGMVSDIFPCPNCDRSFYSQGGFKRHTNKCLKTNEREVLDMSVDKIMENVMTCFCCGEDVLSCHREGEFECDFTGCGMKFKENISLDKHKYIIHEFTDRSVGYHPTEQICVCCNEKLKNAHMVGSFECHNCNKKFIKKSSIIKHMKVMHNGPQLACPKCLTQCPDMNKLKRHLHTHTTAKPFSCPTCNQMFSRKYHLVRHNLQTGCNGTKKTVFPCQVCGREFNRKDNLREHLRAHAGQTKRKKVFTCHVCGLEVCGTSLFAAHKRSHTGEKPYGCSFCSKTFSTSGACKKHTRTHTGERPYECDTCHKRFGAKETLNRHVRIHTGHKPHVCQFCGKKFVQSSQLKSHIYCHTGNSNVQNNEPIPCDFCGKEFNRRARLNEHIKFVHMGAKPFECPTCNKTFIRKEDLNRHLIIHTGVKAHKCPICEKGFAMKSSLKVHLLIHTKEPPRSCDECGRAFIRQDCLLRHMRTKHRDTLEEIMSEAEKKKLQQQLLQVAAETSQVVKKELSEDGLSDSIKELLSLLVDEGTLESLGYPNAPVQDLLEAVIRRCGHEPASGGVMAEKLRHNVKLLFTVVIDDSAVKALLNNQTVDEVILHVLRLAKS